jgi:hypothetical protein
MSNYWENRDFGDETGYEDEDYPDEDDFYVHYPTVEDEDDYWSSDEDWDDEDDEDWDDEGTYVANKPKPKLPKAGAAVEIEKELVLV